MTAFFDGSAYLGGGSTAAGSLNSRIMVVHFWINPADQLNTNNYIFVNNGVGIQVRINAVRTMTVAAENGSGQTIFSVASSTAFNASTGWKSIDIVVDLSSATQSERYARLYVDGSLEGEATNIADPGSGLDIAFEQIYTNVGRFNNSSTNFKGDLAQVYIHNTLNADDKTAGLNDPTSAAWKGAFYDYSGADRYYKQTSLTTALPNSGAPLWLLERDHTEYAVNNGSEGDFTLNGTLSDVTSPLPTKPVASSGGLIGTVTGDIVGSPIGDIVK